MLAVAAGKPIALAEVGGLPSPEVLAKQPRWTYFMAWSELVAASNSVELIKSVYHAPQVLGRDDPRLSAPMEAIRKATADRTAGAPDAQPVTPQANAEAKALLARLASGQGVLSGQESDPSLPAAASVAMVQATGKQPAIFAAELETASSEAHQALVKELIQAHANHQVVSLSWRPTRPTDNAPADPKSQLTDFEWAELLTPSSALNQRWAAQVDQAAATLRELEKAGIAVLWNPYPESNGKDAWWAGRKGVNGSAALYRQLFDRLVNHDGLRNLVWVWEAAPPSFGPGGTGMLSDFFPGLLYADALELRVNDLNPRFPAGRFLAQAAVGKVIGVELKGNLPDPEVFAGPSGWAWFVAAPQAVPATGSDALRKLYASPRVVSLAPAQ
jgi:mannan endo-1,4-beta-mannosidase